MLHHFLRASRRTPRWVANSNTQNPGVGATITVAKPTGTADGDIMFAWMTVGDNASHTWTGDTGWTELIDSTGGKGGRLAYKVASSEGASYTFTANSASFILSATITTWRGGTYTAVGAGAGGTNPVVAASVTATVPDSVLLAFYAGSRASVTITVPPTGMTSLFSDSDATAPSLFGYYERVTTGATGTRSATFSDPTGSCGVLAVMRPT